MALSFDPKPEVAKKVVELGASSFVKKPLESAEEFSVYMSQAKDNDSLKKQNKILSKEKVNQKLFKYFPLGMVVQESETRVAEIVSKPKYSHNHLRGDWNRQRGNRKTNKKVSRGEGRKYTFCFSELRKLKRRPCSKPFIWSQRRFYRS